MRIAIIAAMAKNHVIGREGDLPWRLPDELRHFRRKTMGKPIIMARKTFESLGGALDGRLNIVLSRNRSYQADGAEVYHDLESALDRARLEEPQEAMILGGGTLYEQAVPLADRMYLTIVDAEPSGDTYFPDFPRSDWVEVAREEHPADDRHQYAFTLLTLDRADASF